MFTIKEETENSGAVLATIYNEKKTKRNVPVHSTGERFGKDSPVKRLSHFFSYK